MSGPGRKDITTGLGGRIRILPGDGGIVARSRILRRGRCCLPGPAVAGAGDDHFTQPEPDFDFESAAGML